MTDPSLPDRAQEIREYWDMPGVADPRKAEEHVRWLLDRLRAAQEEIATLKADYAAAINRRVEILLALMPEVFDFDTLPQQIRAWKDRAEQAEAALQARASSGERTET